MQKSQVKKQKAAVKKPIFPAEQVIPAKKRQLGPLDLNLAPLAGAMSAVAASGERLLFLVPDAAESERFAAELSAWLKLLAPGRQPSILLFPEGSGRAERLVAESDTPRSQALARLLSDPPDIVVAPVMASLAPTPSPETLRNHSFTLKVGDSFPIGELAKRLVALDYDDEPEVTLPGEFARRGGLIDIFSFASDRPARIEFFGDEIDSIRLFEPETQLSVKKEKEYEIVMRSGSAAAGDSASDLWDFASLRAFTPVFVFPALIERHLARYGDEAARVRYDAVCAGNSAVRREFLDAAGVAEQPSASPVPCYSVDSLLEAALPEGAGGGFSELARQWNSSMIARWLDEGVSVQVYGRTEADLVHIRTWLAEAGFDEKEHAIQVRSGDLPRGLFLPRLHCAFLTERELFGVPPASAPRFGRAALPDEGADSDSAPTEPEDLSAFSDLEEGDYAVHLQHGICIYRGLETVHTGGGDAEMIALEFDEGAMMHIPLWQAHSVSRYIGAKKNIVHLSRIASAKWGRTKAAAARAVQSLAYGMLRMQAVRSGIRGNPFPPDGLDQKLFEEAFPFRPTADQVRSAEEIKRDMESEKPMDRLLCGDVGFGKTELAMRAAFKAVSAGRQVAVLVPTTVLAQQHYFSFLQRFAGTPIMIEQLSRFKTKSEQTEILRRLADGSLDIVIGTHRLVQNDVRFKNLGLLVIDEEQRFGVEHKERLKRLRVTVDVLTMTATPIPRTLYLSMSGVRDLSTIMSAPVQRLPIRTIVAQKEDPLLHAAIARELGRGGQVYYLYNRVATIEEEAAKIHQMFPAARIGVGHGQMAEGELEDVMSRFIEGKLDILVCTTIIESGIDIPNANTIIIDRADRFGLAELYQLRGRVGRWSRQAYAYLLLPRSGILTGDARKRIAAIRSYTHLGAGFKLAVRDLEIRGSGNILGAEQSGQINAIGFHLYCELLRACVGQLKGETIENPPETELFLDFLVFASRPPNGKISACFPENYVNSPRLRIDCYRRLAAIASESRLDEYEKELRDRFGPLPPEAENMLDCARIRILAAQKKIGSVVCTDSRIYLERSGAYLKPNGMVPRLELSDDLRRRLRAVLACVRNISVERPEKA